MLALLSVLLINNGMAKDGMWIPYLISQLNEGEMQDMGMQLSAEDIYSVNHSSLKDAIVHFNGGCTAQLISAKGLLLTNHHCGYSQIQSHSSVEKDYLKNGFWAMNGKEELRNKKLTAAIVKYMKDVTNEVLEGVNSQMSPEERAASVAANIKKLIAANQDEYKLEVKPFFFGNQYILIAKEVFRDVRLVGAPPSSIGKYGSDTDNWVWPRHTGDFSIFRVYANAQNKPADVSDDNVPYTPNQFLKVNIGGVQNGDFTMVYGFPGTTDEYLPSNEVQNIMEVYDPMRIAIRDEIIAVLDKKMRTDDATRIKYASKYARVSNAWKKWSGEIVGLRATRALEKKQAFEAEFEKAILADPKLSAQYQSVLPNLKNMYEDRKEILTERHAFVEGLYFGVEMFRNMLSYRTLVEAYESSDSTFEEMAANKAKALSGFYKNYDSELDEKVMEKLLPIYLSYINHQPLPDIIDKLKKGTSEEVSLYVKEVFSTMALSNSEDWINLLQNKPSKAIKILKNSAAYNFSTAAFNHFVEVINPEYRSYMGLIENSQREYLKALQAVLPNKRFYPDANSTLRVSYGKVDGYQARDAVNYFSHTYLEGVVAKYKPADYEFDLPQKLIDLYETKDYGPYAEKGKMPVCFIASNHTTGGNSGSPVLNAKGELIGLNFDRTWEGTMSDYNFDEKRCRNIMVDLRYVLFIVDKFAGAGYLVNEMELVSDRATLVEEKAPALEMAQ